MRIDTLTVGMLQEHTYIVSDEVTKAAVIIDPGADAGRIIDFVKNNELDVKKILLTHGHFDHIGAVPELRTAIGCGVIAHEVAPMYLEKPENNLSRVFGHNDLQFAADEYVGDQDLICIEGSDTLTFEVIFAPGHTADGVAFYHRASGNAFVGDIIFRGSVGRSDHPGGNAAHLIHSIQTKIFTLPEDVVVHPGHGPATTVGYEKRTNPYFEW
ncbi:MAG: MBL fold metallo-hydrolase [Cellulosilyticaceae bacterium]